MFASNSAIFGRILPDGPKDVRAACVLYASFILGGIVLTRTIVFTSIVQLAEVNWPCFFAIARTLS